MTRISVSEETLRAVVAELRVEIKDYIHESDDKSRDRYESLATDFSGIPDMVKTNTADIKYLSRRDWWSTGIGTFLAVIISKFWGNQ